MNPLVLRSVILSAITKKEIKTHHTETKTLSSESLPELQHSHRLPVSRFAAMSIARKSADQLSLCFSSLFCYVRYWSFVFYNALENKVVDIISLEKKRKLIFLYPHIALPFRKRRIRKLPEQRFGETRTQAVCLTDSLIHSRNILTKPQ